MSHASQHSVTDLLKQLSEFDGSTEQFLNVLLQVQCHLGQASAGAILRNGQAGSASVLALFPQLPKDSAAPAWLSHCVPSLGEAVAGNRAVVRPVVLADDPARQHVMLLPLHLPGIEHLVAAFLLATADNAKIDASRRQLELTSTLLQFFEMRLTHRKSMVDLQRLQRAMQILTAANRHHRFSMVAMDFCNEIASQWGCQRASIGFLKGRYVRVMALSHVEHFNRKMQFVQDIEAAMEESLDQDLEVIVPAAREATYVSRAAAAFSHRYGPLALLTLPLRRNGEGRAVLMLEREPGRPFLLEEIETIRLTTELATARLLSLQEYDRWFGARLAAQAKEGLAVLVGPKHTWVKVTAFVCAAALLFLIFAKGEFRAEAPFAIEATRQQVAPAPFDGYLKAVNVEVGDVIQGGETVLAELDTAELKLQLAAAEADKLAYLKQAAAAMRDGNTAEAQIAQANADKISAQADLLGYQISQARLVSPLAGILVKGDLKRELGAPVKTGDVLFEVTPLESLRAELQMPEDLIFDVKVGQKGQLATVSYPGRYIGFEVERVNPIAEVVNQRNVFKVRVKLQETVPWLRPGMEGVAKVDVGPRRYAWIWTRKIINWVRMWFWI